MVERMARELCRRTIVWRGREAVVDVGAAVDLEWRAYVGDAEAMLALLRTPTPEMLRPVRHDRTRALSYWEAMIDGAIEGDDEP